MTHLVIVYPILYQPRRVQVVSAISIRSLTVTSSVITDLLPDMVLKVVAEVHYDGTYTQLLRTVRKYFRTLIANKSLPRMVAEVHFRLFYPFAKITQQKEAFA